MIPYEERNISWNNSLQCESSYTGRIYLSQHHIDILVWFTGISLLLNLCSNSSVIYALVKTKQLHNVSMKLILCLSVSDCCLAAFGQPLFITMLIEHNNENFYCRIDFAVEFCVYTFCHGSAFIIILIAYDRYFRMKYLNRYSEFVKTTKIYIAFAIIVFLSVFQTSIQVLSIKLHVYRTVKMICCFVDILKMSLMLLPYMLAVGAVKNHRRQSENKRMLKKVDREFSAIALRITISISIMYTPYVVFDILRFSVRDESALRDSVWYNFGMLMGYEFGMANSFVNAIIFLSSNKKCQRKLFALYKGNSMSGKSSPSLSGTDLRLATLNRVAKVATIRKETIQRENAKPTSTEATES